MLRLILLIGSLCAVAPASAMPARFNPLNIASSILLDVGEFTANERSERNEQVGPDRSPSDDSAAREVARKLRGEPPIKSLLASDRPTQVDLGALNRPNRSPSADGAGAAKGTLSVSGHNAPHDLTLEAASAVRGQGKKPQDKKALVPPPSGNPPDLGHLLQSYVPAPMTTLRTMYGRSMVRPARLAILGEY
jgi:hypothetical protein